MKAFRSKTCAFMRVETEGAFHRQMFTRPKSAADPNLLSPAPFTGRGDQLRSNWWAGPFLASFRLNSPNRPLLP